MAQPIIQTSFHAGEWAPALNARVDLQKYHSAAALLKNFFVNYHGGISSRFGTKYVLQAFKSATAVRIIPFQASFSVNYVIEFGDLYIRFHNNGSPVLETGKNITAITRANPATVTSNAHGFANGDWVFITGVNGMTQVNGRYFRVVNVTANTFQLTHILDSTNVNSSSYSVYTSGGTASRVFTIASPFSAADLALVKYTQNVNTLILTHPSYATQILTLITANNWTIAPIVIGTTLATPTGLAAVSNNPGAVNYSYIVTAVDANGQESVATAPVGSTVNSGASALSTVTLSWTGVAGATSYNVYQAGPSTAGVLPSGSQFGFVGNVTGINSTLMYQAGIGVIGADFSQTVPIPQNPFSGSGVSFITVTSGGNYTGLSVPSVTLTAPPPGGSQATAAATCNDTSISLNNGGQNNLVGDVLSLGFGITIKVDNVSNVPPLNGFIIAWHVLTHGSASGAGTSLPSSVSVSNRGGVPSQWGLTWNVGSVTVISPGSGYAVAPTVSFSPTSATATATLSATAAGNPGVSTFHDQRLVFAGLKLNPQQINFSQPGSYFNFDIHNPIEDDDAIQASLVSGRLNTIKSMISMPAGLIVLSDQAAWVVNGGSAGSAVSPINITAHPQAYSGANDIPPIIANQDILFVQSKNSIVRQLTYNFYTNIYTGTDVTVLSSHLFFGSQIDEWTWAEEPFKLVWAVRNDGILLSMAYLKEQELIGWTQHDTNGLFNSVCSVTETISQGSVNAVYFVVQRIVNGNTVQYIERLADRYPVSYLDTSIWCVDAGLQYNASPATVFRGLDHLVGMTVTGLADGAVIPPTVVAADGVLTLAQAASVVTVGLAFTPQLQTLAIDVGEPTIQSKMKAIPAVTVRCDNTLGLSIGSTFNNLVAMKDLQIGNVGSMTNQVVMDLVTADARTFLDTTYTVPGQYCIQQSNPYPATILGVIPQITVGDTPK